MHLVDKFFNLEFVEDVKFSDFLIAASVVTVFIRFGGRLVFEPTTVECRPKIDRNLC